MKRLLLVCAVGALLVPSSASARHSWGQYHWARTANPFTLKLGDNVSSGWDSYLNTASGDWTASTVLNTSVVAGQAGSNCQPTAGRTEVCSGAYGNNGWLGLAQIWLTSGNHITQGTAQMNDTYMNSAPYNTAAWHRLVMCQEVAHTFGLDHQDENFNNSNLGTCMDYTSNPTGPPSNEHPNQGDFDQLRCIYEPGFSGARTATHRTGRCRGHTDTFNTIGLITRPGSSTFFRPGPHRGTIVTHVFWASPF
jgi:hypothetical protein